MMLQTSLCIKELESGMVWGVVQKADRLYYFIMAELEKYRKLAEHLEAKPEGSCQELSEFYFRQLERLDIDLLLAQIEVSEQQRQIAAIEAKIAIVREEQGRTRPDRPDPEVDPRRESSSEEILGEYLCPLKNCGKRFQKQSGVRLHNRLVHSQGGQLMEGSVFTYEWVE